MSLEEENIEYNNRLQALSDSDFQIVEGEPDITGWNVLSSGGTKFGEVEDLLFDPETRDVRYLVVELQENGGEILEDRLILVPIGVAELHTEDDDVIIPNVTASQLVGLPVYGDGVLSPENEMHIRNVFEGGTTATYNAHDFYQHDHFNEDRFYQPRTVTVIEETIIISDDSTQQEEAERKEKVRRIIARIEAKNNERD